MKTINKHFKEQIAYKKAKLRYNKIRQFYLHLKSYVIVNFILLLINLLFSPNYWWIVYPVIAWGYCLLVHAWGAFSTVVEIDDRLDDLKM